MKKLLLLTLFSLFAFGLWADDKPQYPGGEQAMNQFIADNLKYPQTALDNGIEGNVNLQFIVKTDGSISSIKVVRMIDPDLENEAMRLVRIMPSWIPASKDGTVIESTTTVVIPFRLP